MGNKQKLQTNNTELSSILSTVKGLPVIDDVKNGAYVWKKYTPEKTYSFNVTMITSSPPKIKVSSNDIDLSKVDDAFWIGAKIFFSTTSINYLEVGGTPGALTLISTYSSGGIAGVYNATWDASTQQLSAVGSAWTLDNTVRIEDKKIEKTLVGYVVSDNESAYPDGGVKDGYWYEKFKSFMFGLTKEAHGTFTFTTDTSGYTLEHNLGTRPKLVIIYTDDSLKGSQYTIRARIFVDRSSYDSTSTNNSLGVAELYNSTSYSSFEVFTYSGDTIQMNSFNENSLPTSYINSHKFKAGATYYWQVMA